MKNRSLLLSLAVASCLAAAGASAEDPAAPDTSAWKCSKCGFEGDAYQSDVELGGGYLDDSSAKFGDYTGLTDKGGYVVADAAGVYTTESGYGLAYQMTDLGLDSRAIDVEGGKQGAYEFGLFYDRVPVSIWDTTETPFEHVGSRNLTLPSDWVYGGSTSGMTTLDENLHPVDVGYDRDRYGIGGRYFWGQNLVLAVDFKRDDRSGFRSQFGSFGSTSTQLLAPVDDSTDRITASLRYQSDGWFVELGYNGSFYSNNASSFDWTNPFAPIVPGGEEGRMALAPDNGYNEIALSAGMYGLPWNTTVALSAAAGKGTQDAKFLPYTINPDITTQPLPMSNLHGSVDVTRADLSVTSRPVAGLRLRGAVTYDESKNDSNQADFDSAVYTDVFPLVGSETNPVYGFDRFRVYGSADYDVYKDVTVGLGGEYRELKRTGTKQEVTRENFSDGWGRVEYRPSGYLGIVLRGGAQERKPDGYDTEVAEQDGQNPLMRKYNMAYLWRTYGELVANLAVPTLPVTLGASVFYAGDSYTKSEIGLRSGLTSRYAIDLNWAINEKFSAYVNGGQEQINSKQAGSSTFSDWDWKGQLDDSFDMIGAGVTAQFTEKLRLDLGYTYARGDSRTTITGVDAGDFPAVTSKLNSVKADLSYGVNDRLDLMFSWWYENFDSSDWALAGIGPATLPTVLALGADPYNYSVNYVTLSARYSFGSRSGEEAAEE